MASEIYTFKKRGTFLEHQATNNLSIFIASVKKDLKFESCSFTHLFFRILATLR